MLVVTFGRAASQELRERVRDAAGATPSGRSPTRRRRRRRRPAARPLLADGDDDEVAAAPPAARRARRLRRRDHRHHPPVLPAGAERRWASPATPTPGATLVENLDDLVVEVVDDLYLAALRPDRPTRRRSPRDGALALAREVVGDPHARLEPERRRRRHAGAAPGRFAARGPRPRSSAASAGSASSATTTCSAGWPTRSSRPGRAGPGRGCGAGGRSCWSTSSRTPTRCSGRSSSGLRRARARWS